VSKRALFSGALEIAHRFGLLVADMNGGQVAAA
jgi:hypothetical protein